MMQPNEQFYRDQAEQDDYFDADLTDAHWSVGSQTISTIPGSNHGESASHSLAERFMHTLQQIEETKEVEPLVALFSETAGLINLAMHHPVQGREHIRQFWQNYLSVFGQIHSRFTHVSQGNGTITLEWTSEGSSASGEPLSYRGVSILEVRDDLVEHFRTYYDSAVFLPQIAK
jgi:hypothetical protein